MSMMNDIFRDFLDRFVIVFIDDILIHSKSLDEHFHHIRQVLTRLRQHSLFVKQSKCEFSRSSIPFLGHIISHNQLSMDPSKIKPIQDWKPPTSIKELQAFLGLANYYRKSIQHFATITSPLSNLLRNTEGFDWGHDKDKAFEAIKQALTSSPTLALPNPSLPYTIWTNASSVATGAILCQDQGHGLQPLAFDSRKLKPAECNYATHDREMLAIVHAIKSGVAMSICNPSLSLLTIAPFNTSRPNLNLPPDRLVGWNTWNSISPKDIGVTHSTFPLPLPISLSTMNPLSGTRQTLTSSVSQQTESCVTSCFASIMTRTHTLESTRRLRPSLLISSSPGSLVTFAPTCSSTISVRVTKLATQLLMVSYIPWTFLSSLGVMSLLTSSLISPLPPLITMPFSLSLTSSQKWRISFPHPPQPLHSMLLSFSSKRWYIFMASPLF
ncbi:hypothetical protein CLOM_g23567 [Closterium sp. NIES-68]|nr:hypothetical protein CLOM_g23567 [Closterium sp. NIES-68]